MSGTSIFQRVTRYPLRENRLTEITAAVLERVDGLARVVAVELMRARPTMRGYGPEPDSAGFRDALDVATERRIEIRTQRPTIGGGFVDLELRFVIDRLDRSRDLLLWIEVKHGSDVSGDQLVTYRRDIQAVGPAATHVVILAPRQSPPDPDAARGTPVRFWQDVGRAIKRALAEMSAGSADALLVREYLTYLKEEQLMEAPPLRARHIVALEDAPEANTVLAALTELVFEHVTRKWDGQLLWSTVESARGRHGAGFCAQYSFAQTPYDEQDPAAPWLEWLLARGGGGRFERKDLAFKAGASAYAKNHPGFDALGAGWLTRREEEGFAAYPGDERRLFRFMYLDEVLAAQTLEEQAELVGTWVADSFRLVEGDYPPAPRASR